MKDVKWRMSRKFKKITSYKIFMCRYSTFMFFIVVLRITLFLVS